MPRKSKATIAKEKAEAEAKAAAEVAEEAKVEEKAEPMDLSLNALNKMAVAGHKARMGE